MRAASTGLSATEVARVTAIAAHVRSLEDVVRRPDLALLEVVVQDEYTHDVVVAAGASYLVFDTT